jgi:hypothetical protein
MNNSSLGKINLRGKIDGKRTRDKIIKEIKFNECFWVLLLLRGLRPRLCIYTVHDVLDAPLLEFWSHLMTNASK